MELFENATDGSEEVTPAVDMEKHLALPPAVLILIALMLAILVYVTSCSLCCGSGDTYRKQ